MLEHHGCEQAAVPHLRGTMVTIFQMKIVFQALVAAFGGSPGIVGQFPLLRISWRDVNKARVVFRSKVNCAAKFRIRTRG